ncbi:hypothetical protein [Plantactinospora sp. WMMB782]|uniref:hypothetical protein n=1 Tax=Plantactinospora sp. WMMB782 TaxID=3404121 RepID=UPI003B94891B
MTASEHDLEEMLAQAWSLPDGPARFAALDTVFRHADAAGNVEFAFRARMNSMSGFHHGGDPTRLFLAFSWCLATFDKQPEVAHSHDAHSLLWNFKWVVWSLPQFPEIPLERTAAVLDDMERRYLLGGHSLHAVYQHRWLVAHHVGDFGTAQEWYDRLLTAPRDGLSDCHACVPSGQVRHLVSLGRYEEAITVGEPYKRGGCTEQPQWMLAELLPAMLHTGRLDDAVDAFRRGYALVRNDRHHLDNIGRYLHFCGLTGNETHGLEIVERHLGWLERPSSPYAAMEFASAAAQVLGRLRAAGHGDLVVRRRFDGGRREETSVARLHDELVAHARELAARFDARNGNTHQSGRVEARMVAEPVVDRLPLTVLAGRAAADQGSPLRKTLDRLLERLAGELAAGDEPGAARTRFEVARTLHEGGGDWQDAVEAAEEALRSLSGAGLTDLVLSCRYVLWQLYSGRIYQHRAEAAEQIAALVAAERLPAEVPPVEVLLEGAADRAPASEAIGWLIEAADRHRLRAARRASSTSTAASGVGGLPDPGNGKEAGDGEQAGDGDPVAAEFRTLRKALLRLSSQPPNERGLTVLARVDGLLAAGQTDGLLPAAPDTSPEDLVALQQAAAKVLAGADRLDEAMARLDQAVALLGDVPDQEQAAAIRSSRARLLLHVGRPAEAEADARAAIGAEPDAWTGPILLVKALRAQDRQDEAAKVMTEHNLDEEDLDYDDE